MCRVNIYFVVKRSFNRIWKSNLNIQPFLNSSLWLTIYIADLKKIYIYYSFKFWVIFVNRLWIKKTGFDSFLFRVRITMSALLWRCTVENVTLEPSPLTVQFFLVLVFSFTAVWWSLHLWTCFWFLFFYFSLIVAECFYLNLMLLLNWSGGTASLIFINETDNRCINDKLFISLENVSM